MDLVTEVAEAVEPPMPPTPEQEEALPARTPIANGEWVITIQLEVNDDVLGDPLVLHFADSAIAGSKKGSKKRGMPTDVGWLVSRAIHQRALQLKGKRK